MSKRLVEDTLDDLSDSEIISELEQDFLEVNDDTLLDDFEQEFIESDSLLMHHVEQIFAENQTIPIQIGEGSANEINNAVHITKLGEKENFKFGAKEIAFAVRINSDELPSTIRSSPLQTMLDTLRFLFQMLISLASTGLKPADLMRFCIFSNSLDRPISTCLMKVSDMTPDTILNAIMKVLQSKDAIPFDETLKIDVITVFQPSKVSKSSNPGPSGSGRKKITNIEIDRLSKRSVYAVPATEDQMCCARAIVVGLALINQDPDIRKIRDDRCILQRNKALELHHNAEVFPGPCGVAEIKKFEDYLGIQIYVVSSDVFNKVSYKGDDKPQKLFLWNHGSHFDLITNMKGFHGSNYYCIPCDTPFDHHSHHLCSHKCRICYSYDCRSEVDTYCAECNRICASRECFQRHKDIGPKQKTSYCHQVYKCRECQVIVETSVCPRNKHKCQHFTCRACKKYVPREKHLCCMIRIAPEAVSEKYIFFDFETDQSSGEHLVNFAVAQYFNGVEEFFSGPNACHNFCVFLFSPQHKGYTAIAHNLKGFDGQFIVHWLINQGRKPDVVPNGSKLMRIECMGVTLIDSFNFLPMALSKLPKSFGIEELKKGFFAHNFNTPENQNYVGILPGKEYFNHEMMPAATREAFNAWYEQRRHQPFDFQKEMKEYCRSDVDILRRCCMKFREQFMAAKPLTVTAGDVDPFRYMTIASACMAVYRGHHLPLGKMASTPLQGYITAVNYSKDSIRWLVFLARKYGIQIHHALNGLGEHRIEGIFVDGLCVETSTVYMYHGCFFHGCPKCFDGDVVNNINNRRMRDLFLRTEVHKKKLLDAGYQYVEIWEHDFVSQCKEIYKTIQDVEIIDRLNPRDSFFGGRTNAVKLYYEGPAHYVDFTSLYPFVNKYSKYPVGHPEVITEKFGNLNDYFGIIKCKVLPPRGLYHPVLPMRSNGKLMFSLCRLCTETLQQESCSHTDEERMILGTWVTEEVKKAVEKGYIVKKIYEVYHFADSSTELFASYINLFLKIKQESSGWPTHCKTEEQKIQYIRNYAEKEGVELEYDMILENPGRRQVAKLALNSFWGRLGMKSNKVRLEYFTDVDKFFKILNDSTIEVKDMYMASANIAALQWCFKTECIPQDMKTNIFCASFTTTYARLHLYDKLDKLGERVIYYDTDSIIYKDGVENLGLGDYLGELTNELDEGDVIETFVSGGPKNYAYRTKKGKEICKIKGFNINYKNSFLLNLETVRTLILDPCHEVEVINPSKITTDGKRRKVINKFEKKRYKFTYNKRRIHVNFDTTPYGY